MWKFLVTFADVLGLWPFTLDEFVQAFHDHVSYLFKIFLICNLTFNMPCDSYLIIYFPSIFQDSRLLGEVHVALLRCIIKDIENVTRSPSAGLGSNQSSAPNPGGGHLHVVEGVRLLAGYYCS